MNKQAVLDVLNSLEVIGRNGGDDAYVLVANTQEVRDRLKSVGFVSAALDPSILGRYGDEESFCILAFAFGEGFCDEYRDGKLVLWGSIDDELRQRVINGEGTAIDAERLLRQLEPDLFGG